MIIQRLFSSKKKSEGDLAKGAGLVAGAAVLGKGGDLGDVITEESERYLRHSKLTAKDKEVIKEKLKEKAKKQGIKVIEDPNFENSSYTGSKIAKKAKETLAKGVKFARKYGDKSSNKELKEALDKIPKVVEEESGSKHIWRSLGKDRILMGKGSLSDTDVLSHELGHAQYMQPGRSKSVVGKAAHSLSPISGLATDSGKPGKLVRGTIFVHGVRAGMKKEKDKREGKKIGAWDKVRSVAIPAAIVAPTLISEGKASLNGLKTMKKLGASKELMNQSRKRLGAAFGTYTGQAGKVVAIGGSGELAGRGVSKIIHSGDDKKEKGGKKSEQD